MTAAASPTAPTTMLYPLYPPTARSTTEMAQMPMTVSQNPFCRVTVAILA